MVKRTGELGKMTSNQREKEAITVEQFFNECPPDLKLELAEGSNIGGEKRLDSPRIQNLGLALAGYPDYLLSGCIQILGSNEVDFLDQLDSDNRVRAIAALPFEKITCILVTSGNEIPNELLLKAKETGTQVFKTSSETSKVITSATKYLEKVLAKTASIHGVFLGMYELGVLILGESGIGKSECALDLIMRGHRLISDDSVILTNKETFVEADAPKMIREYLEIRGLGILNIRDLFGVAAIGTGRKIDLCINLVKREASGEIDRLGLEMDREDIFGCEVPSFKLQVSPGRNLSTLIETAVRVYLLKASGKHAAQQLIEKHNAAVSGNF